MAAKLIEQGHIVYSPLTMTHPIDIILADDGATLGSDYWVAFDKAFMSRCDEIAVLKLDGWEASKGVQFEIEFFRQSGKPIWSVNLNSKVGTVSLENWKIR